MHNELQLVFFLFAQFSPCKVCLWCGCRCSKKQLHFINALLCQRSVILLSIGRRCNLGSILQMTSNCLFSKIIKGRPFIQHVNLFSKNLVTTGMLFQTVNGFWHYMKRKSFPSVLEFSILPVYATQNMEYILHRVELTFVEFSKLELY